MKIFRLLVLLLTVIGTSSSIAAPYPIAGTAAPRSAPPLFGAETNTCLREAAKDGSPKISIAVHRLFQAGDFIRVSLSIENLTDSPVWMNLKPFALEGSGLATDQQLFVTIHAPQERTGRAIEYDVVKVPNRNYGVIGAHKRRDLIVPVNGIGLDLRPGTYQVDTCFWDRNRKAPTPPRGAIIVRGPVGVSQNISVTP